MLLKIKKAYLKKIYNKDKLIKETLVHLRVIKASKNLNNVASIQFTHVYFKSIPPQN